MKNTFFTNHITARLIIAIIIIYSGFFISTLIYVVITKKWFDMLYSIPFIILGVGAYISYEKKGVFNRISITDMGISLIRGFKKQTVFIPWENIINIQRLTKSNPGTIRIESDILVGNKPTILYIESRYEIDQLVEKYFYKHLIIE